MSISTTFKDILVSDTVLGCRLNIRLGRLDCSTAPYNIKLSATTSVFTTNGVIKFTWCGWWVDSSYETTGSDCERTRYNITSDGGKRIHFGIRKAWYSQKCKNRCSYHSWHPWRRSNGWSLRRLGNPSFPPPNRAMLIVHSSSIGSNLTSSKRHHERIHLNPSLTYQI